MTTNTNKSYSTSSPCPALESYLNSSGKNANKSQQSLAKSMMQVMNTSDGILLAEAGTGVGKGAVTAACAIQTHLNEGGVSVVAAPSFKILRQLISEHLIIQSSLQETIPYVLIAGKNEFVAAENIKQYCVEFAGNEDVAQIEKWIADGAKDAPECLAPKCWSVSGLSYYAPLVSEPDKFSLQNNTPVPSDKGLLSYYSQFVAAKTAAVIYCTHAMLAWHTINDISAKYRALTNNEVIAAKMTKEFKLWLSNEGKKSPFWLIRNDILEDVDVVAQHATSFPEFTRLFIDEAHIFEQSFSNATSRACALSTLFQLFKKNGVTGLAELDVRIKSLYKQSSSSDGVLWIGKADNKLLGELKELSLFLKRTANKIPKKKDHVRKEISNALRIIQLCFNGDRNAAFFSFSPVKGYISIHAGHEDVNRELDYLWRNKRVCLISASLYLPSTKSDRDSGYISRLLQIPLQRKHEMTPIRPSWLYDQVTIVTPELNQLDSPIKLLPDFHVKIDGRANVFALNEARWHSETAQYIQDASNSAAGGTLVLVTSYRSIELIGAQLSPILGERLVLSSTSEKIESTINRYLALSQRGIKPVWIATGQSWTGTDISGRQFPGDYDASTDNVITDLIIPRLPFGTNRTMSHEFRKSYGFVNEINEVIMKMIQGMGRLVRTEGLPDNRKIHILDKRIALPDYTPMLGEALSKVLDKYKKRLTAYPFNVGWIFAKD